MTPAIILQCQPEPQLTPELCDLTRPYLPVHFPSYRTRHRFIPSDCSALWMKISVPGSQNSSFGTTLYELSNLYKPNACKRQKSQHRSYFTDFNTRFICDAAYHASVRCTWPAQYFSNSTQDSGTREFFGPILCACTRHYQRIFAVKTNRQFFSDFQRHQIDSVRCPLPVTTSKFQYK